MIPARPDLKPCDAVTGTGRVRMYDLPLARHHHTAKPMSPALFRSSPSCQTALAAAQPRVAIPLLLCLSTKGAIITGASRSRARTSCLGA